MQILKPAFTILADHETKTFLLLIRGTHSIKDTLTAATGAVVPFHHSVVHEGGVSNLVLGYAHCGMVAAARWIAKLATPRLTKAFEEHPDYKIKVLGSSTQFVQSLVFCNVSIDFYVENELKKIVVFTSETVSLFTVGLLRKRKNLFHYGVCLQNGGKLILLFPGYFMYLYLRML